jgi:hypothetical protein
MSLFFSRHLRLFSALAAAVWVVVLIVSIYALVTSTLAFDDAAYYSMSALIGGAILCTTAALVGVQARASALTDEPVRGAGLLGVGAAALATVFVFAIPAWVALFLWAIGGTVVRSRDTDLTSPRMRLAVLVGVGVCALAIPVTGFLALTGDVLGAALWGTLAVLSAVLIGWHIELAARAVRTAPPSAPRRDKGITSKPGS